MPGRIARRTLLGATAAAALVAPFAGFGPAFGQDKVTLRLSSPATPTDQRAVALTEVFAPAVAHFATFEPHWNATLFKQGTELEAIARGNLEMSITSAQELASLIPAWSIFTAGYLHRDAEHQKKVFAADFMNPMKEEVENTLGVKLLTVMYLGRLVELGAADRVFTAPMHPYTQALIAAVPLVDPGLERARKRLVLAGEVPSALDPPSGCAFHPRCPYRFDPCDKDVPELLPVDGHHAAACHLSLADKERIRSEEVLVR